MLRKVIFVCLAILLAYMLGVLLYETWRSGQIHVVGRNRSEADYSYSSEHAKFLLHFSIEVFGAICAVLMLLGLGWSKKGPDRTEQ